MQTLNPRRCALAVIALAVIALGIGMPQAVAATPAEGCPTALMGGARGTATATTRAQEPVPLNKRPAALAAALGTPARVLVGLGTTDISLIQKQGLRVDIYDQYLSGVGPEAWPNYNSPRGAYIPKVTHSADCLGAVPMFTLYQMASFGDSNLSGLRNFEFMRQYWDNVRLLFTRLKAYGKPALVNFEPDFWGYTQRVSRDPSQQFAHVSQANSDCAMLSNDIIGIAGCLLHMARTYAPNAYVGFPPSGFPDIAANEIAYMKRIGAGKADFSVMQTLDRDIGCMEARYQAANCNRAHDAQKWDENNLSSPNFKEHFARSRAYFEALGLPLLWWQTPLGAASNTPGGQANAFRDNRVAYFLSHAQDIAAAGGIGVVFSPGHTSQTNITTDGGQFKRLSAAYLARPAALP